MKANKKLKVQCLSAQDAIQLFDENVGEDTLNLHPDIPKYAKEIVNECKGLPLALITTGRAMASMKTLDEWASAIRVLRNNPPEFPNMVDDVYNLLRFSYDRLDSTRQHCFLYCALFPEDYNIDKALLIDLWIGEGFLGDTDNINRPRDRGQLVMGNLKSACLLESGELKDVQVKMHDVLRDMALWLAREHGEKENKIIVEEEDVSINRWKEAKRVSVQGRKIYRVTELPECFSLKTLLINETMLETLSEGFFNSMQVFRVLDMSSNARFNELPKGVGRLVNLQYLNLSGTSIKVLPDELKYLSSLLYLLLDGTDNLVNISKEVISSLLSLKVFRKTGTKHLSDERGLMEGLQSLNWLDELSTAFSVQKFLESPKLQSSIIQLEIIECSNLTAVRIPTSSLRKILHLNDLQLIECDSLESMEIYEDSESMIPMHVNDRLSRGIELTNLHQVGVYVCDKLRNLSWLIYAPNLQNTCSM